MGANAQTTVPTFTAGQLLTADQQNQSARTGVPVFATTATRDAAFGGSGEKTLAEGQLAYIEATDVVQYYNGTAWATLAPASAGALVVVKAQTSFSAASSVTADSVFTSTYTHYLMQLRFTTSTTGVNINMRLRASGTSASGANYNNQFITGYSSTASAVRQTSQTSFSYVGAASTQQGGSIVTFQGPQLAAPTIVFAQMQNDYGAFTSLQNEQWVGNHTLSTSYDGIELLTSTGTMTGNYTIYGYAQT